MDFNATGTPHVDLFAYLGRLVGGIRVDIIGENL
jgi:hypothetical protein